jgi:hypothetical protein
MILPGHISRKKILRSTTLCSVVSIMKEVQTSGKEKNMTDALEDGSCSKANKVSFSGRGFLPRGERSELFGVFPND